MKKFIVAILSILYISSAAGATVHLHYCMGKLVDMGLWHGKAPKCSNCESKKKMAATCSKKCCKDKHQQVKVPKDQKTAATVAFEGMHLTAIALPAKYPVLPEAIVLAEKFAYPPSNAPPQEGTGKLYLLHSIFLI